MNRNILFLLIAQMCAPMVSMAMVTLEPHAAPYKPIELTGTLVTLQATTIEHRTGIRTTLTPKVFHSLGWTAFDIKGIGIDVWILKQEYDNSNGNGFAFTICDKNSKDVIGTLSIYPHKSLPTHAVVSGWTAEQYWEQDHYKEALGLALAHLFAQRPAITTCIARVKQSNKHALTVYQTYGFKVINAQPTDTHVNLVYSRLQEKQQTIPTPATAL